MVNKNIMNRNFGNILMSFVQIKSKQRAEKMRNLYSFYVTKFIKIIILLIISKMNFKNREKYHLNETISNGFRFS